METSFAPRDHGVVLPAIYPDDKNAANRGFGVPSRPSFSSTAFSPPPLASIPMSIPNTSPHRHAPPPLPPPKYVPVAGPDSAAVEKYRRRELDGAAADEELPHYKTRPDRDEGYHSLESPLGRDIFGSGRFGMHHDQFRFRSSADAYDSSLLKKFDARRTLENRSPPRFPGLSASARDAQRPSRDTFAGLPMLSLPTRSKNPPILESPSRYTETPLHSAVSPRGTPFGHLDYRLPPAAEHAADLERSPPARSRRTNSDDAATVSTQGSYEANGDEPDFAMEEAGPRLQEFHIGRPPADYHQSLGRPVEYRTVGQKRRASSPPGDEPPLHSMPSSGDLLRRREGVSRGSPTPRLTVVPQQGSVSSVSSAGRSNSYASTMSLTASSMTSMNSFRRSPGGLSPVGMSPTESPYGTPISLTTSPRVALPRVPNYRQLSEQHKALTSPRKLSDVPKSSVTKIQDFFMCDCCPKKPKKFETAEELSAHEAEKQYECSFCGNRFKNKNEAERHQNSLHVRRHSWSCSVLSGYDRAFHESTARPGEADTCGYCGEEYMRTGMGPSRQAPRHPSEADWEERIRHLQDVHKFRECNASKKFYRADHFRQHLKHSHAGTSGKWTNMLENACMLEEEPPVAPSR